MSLRQIRKLLKLIAVAAPIVILYRVLALGHAPSDVLLEFARFITFTNNLTPNIWNFVSVWWFFALIMQLYLLFPLLLAGMMKRPGLTVSAVLSALWLAGVFHDHPWVTEHGLVLFATPLSHAAVFTLGIGLALGRSMKQSLVTFFACVFLYAQFVPVLFTASMLSLTVMSLYAYDRWGRGLTDSKLVMWFGSITMYVFVLHGFLRQPWTKMVNTCQTELFAEKGATAPLITLVIFVLWFFSVTGTAALLERLHRRLRWRG